MTALLLAAPAAARFAPPADVPLRYVTTVVRGEGAGERRFVVERRVTFRRDAAGGGWVATLETLPPPRSAAGPEAMFGAAHAALAGVPLRLRLDAAGALIAVEDEAAAWARFVAAVRGMGGARNAAQVAAATRSLDAMPEPARRALLAEPLAPLLAPSDADLPAGTDRRVTVPGRGASGLAGRETAASLSPQLIRITTRAEGTLPPGPVEGRTVLLRTRDVERATGLVRAFAEERLVTIRYDGDERREREATSFTLDPAG